MKNVTIISRYALYICLLLLGISCSKKEDIDIGVIAPLNCVYSGDLELDERTKDALSQYKEKFTEDE